MSEPTWPTEVTVSVDDIDLALSMREGWVDARERLKKAATDSKRRPLGWSVVAYGVDWKDFVGHWVSPVILDKDNPTAQTQAEFLQHVLDGSTLCGDATLYRVFDTPVGRYTEKAERKPFE